MWDEPDIFERLDYSKIHFEKTRTFFTTWKQAVPQLIIDEHLDTVDCLWLHIKEI